MSQIRVMASFDGDVLATGMDPALRARQVTVMSYTPVETPLTYMEAAEAAKAAQGMTHYLSVLFDKDPPRTAPARTPRALARVTNRLRRRRGEAAAPALRDDDRRRVAALLDDLAGVKGLRDLAATLDGARRDPELARLIEERLRHFDFGPAVDDENDGGGLVPGAGHIDPWDSGYWPDPDEVVPKGLPSDTGQIGYLFEDALRVEGDGLTLGDHVYSLTLAPGEQVTLKQSARTVRTTRRSEGFESELTRALVVSDTQRRTEATEETEGSTAKRREEARARLKGLGVEVPEHATVEAKTDIGVASDTEQASTLSATQTRELFRERAARTSEALRRSHEVSFTVSRVEEEAASSKRVIANPNPHSGLTAHYFTVLQRQRLSVERRGVRLCWTPFLERPGLAVLARLEKARQTIEQRALDRLPLPAPPVPPAPEMATEWASGLVLRARNFGTATMLVPIPPEMNATGRVRLNVTGEDADDVSAEILGPLTGNIPRKLTPEERDFAQSIYESHLEVESIEEILLRPMIVIRAYFRNGRRALRARGFSLRVDAEVTRQLPGYQAALEQYHALRAQWEDKVSAMRAEALALVQPDIAEARAEILGTIDVRGELLDQVVQTFIEPLSDGSALEVERWHRIIDFDRISWTLYPGWWSQGAMAFPELPPDHLLNASWARVFLPVRVLPADTPEAESYEAKLLFQLFRPDLAPADPSMPPGAPGGPANSSWVAVYNDVVAQVVGPLRTLQEGLRGPDGDFAPTPIGAPWVETVPTDGTHAEFVLSRTTAADPQLAAQAQAAIAKAEAKLAAREAATELTRRVEGPVRGKVKV